MERNSAKKSIAIISMAREDQFFIRLWIEYYSKHFGAENLFLVLDGLDQSVNTNKPINIIKVPHRVISRRETDRNRAELISDFSRGLFKHYDIVIAHDIDEFLILDPKINTSIFEYLQKDIPFATLSGLGLDIVQHLDLEKPLTQDKLLLEERQFALISSEYTKPVVATKPVLWGSGFHRVKIKNFHIDPNLFLFHTGMIDYKKSKEKRGDTTKIHETIALHLQARYKLFEEIKKHVPVNGDSVFEMARKHQYNLFNRKILWPTKPAPMKSPVVITIPERFRNIF